MKDYIVVGAGLAGIAFAETAIKHGKSVVVFDNDSQHSSAVAAGVFNPVILKRFSPLADAQQQLGRMHEFYGQIKHRLNIDCKFDMPILRRFASVEEQNNWFAAADKQGLSAFMSTELNRERIAGIDSPYGFGLVLQTGFVDTAAFLKQYRAFLERINSYIQRAFDHSKLAINGDFVSYEGIEARHIVFAEGYGIKANPYFNYLPLDGTKGEILEIRANLELSAIVKAGVFVLPAGDGVFKVGATYNWDDKTETPTESAREELVQKLAEFASAEFEILDQKAGIRPTVKDRKPLVGTHPEFKNLHILNGLGTRGVMLGPSMAEFLYQSVESQAEIPANVNISRFPYNDLSQPDRN